MAITTTNLPRFKYGSPDRITETEISNGALIVDSTNGHLYVDLNNTRIQLGDFIHVTNAEGLPTGGGDKLYLDDSTGDIYYYLSNSWHTINQTSSPILLAGNDTAMNALVVAANVGKVALFTGTSTQTYAKGHLYLIGNGETQGTYAATDISTVFAAASHQHTTSDLTDFNTAVGELIETTEVDTIPLNELPLVPTTGTTGHVLTKTENGYSWQAPPSSSITLDDVPTSNSNNAVKSGGVYTALNDKMNTPAGGTAGQVLTKTENGYGWAAVSGGGGSVDLSNVIQKGTSSNMSSATTGQVYLYADTTSANFTQGHIYKCTGTQAGGYTVVDTYLNSLAGTYTPTGNTAQGAPTYYCAETQKYLWLAFYMDDYYCWAFTSSAPIAEMTGAPDAMLCGFDVYLDVDNNTQGPNFAGTWLDGSMGTYITDGDPDAVISATPTAGGPVFTDITPPAGIISTGNTQINNVTVVSELPNNPDANTVYLIPESQS